MVKGNVHWFSKIYQTKINRCMDVYLEYRLTVYIRHNKSKIVRDSFKHIFNL